MKAKDAPELPTLYRYVVQPSLAYTGLTTSLTLYVTNPPDDPVDATATRITVTIPGGDAPSDLVTLADQSNIAATSGTKGWECAKVTTEDGTAFRIYPDPGVTLPAGGTVSVTFSSIHVVSSAGPTYVAVLEAFGSRTASGSLTVTKVAPGLAAAASIAPATLGAHATATISWSAAAAAYVTIVGPNENQDIPLQGAGPIYSGQTPVLPAQDAPQSAYTVTAWTNDGSSSAAPPVVATLSPPLLTFSAHPLGPLDLDAQAELDWQVDYGIQAFIAPPPQGGLGQVNPKGTLSFAPGTFLQGNADAVTFSLRATGYKPPPPDTVTFTFNPAEILSFTYEDLASKVPRYVKRNGFAQLVEKDGLYTLTVTGPGGPLVQYLGPGPYLQVQYFAASPDPAPSGGPVTLQWVTLNAASLELQDGVSSKPLTPVAQGTTQVTPTADTTYVLVATAADGQQVTSQLTVTVAS